MRKMTKEFLETAFAGESMAHMRYLIFSEKAEMEGNRISRGCLRRSPTPNRCTRPTTTGNLE